MSDSHAWGVEGDKRPVVPELLARLDMHSPALATQLRWYLGQREQAEDRHTYNGQDVSALLSLQLLEVLILYQQLRMELADQPFLSAMPGKVPGHLALAMNGAMSLEPVLLQAATAAMEVHLTLWNVHAGAAPWAEVAGVTPASPEEHRGRWTRDPNADEPDGS